jgi:hypothetical protein
MKLFELIDKLNDLLEDNSINGETEVNIEIQTGDSFGTVLKMPCEVIKLNNNIVTLS